MSNVKNFEKKWKHYFQMICWWEGWVATQSGGVRSTLVSQKMLSVKWGSQILVLTSKTWNNYKGAPLHAFCCTKKGFKVPQIAPWSFVKIWTKNITPHVLVHCVAIFQRICKCHTISESWDHAQTGIEAHLIENSTTNEK